MSKTIQCIPFQSIVIHYPSINCKKSNISLTVYIGIRISPEITTIDILTGNRMTVTMSMFQAGIVDFTMWGTMVTGCTVTIHVCFTWVAHCSNCEARNKQITQFVQMCITVYILIVIEHNTI